MISTTVFIGIDRYHPKTGINNLAGCVSDMVLMKETMTLVMERLPKDTLILVDEEATTRNILGALDHLVGKLRAGEQAFLYYAGHGGEVPNVSPTPEDPEEYDQMLVPHDFCKTEPLLDDIVRSFLSRVPAGAHLTMVLDSCHAGGMARAPMSMEEGKAYQREGWAGRSIGQISRAQYSPAELVTLQQHKESFLIEPSEQGFIMLAAAQPDELAWERTFGEKKHGIFTYHICEALRQTGGRGTPVELVNHAYRQIKTYRNNQTPRLIGQEQLFHRPLLTT